MFKKSSKISKVFRRLKKSITGNNTLNKLKLTFLKIIIKTRKKKRKKRDKK